MNHVWHFGPLIICQGCFLVTSGMVLGLIVYFIMNLTLKPLEWFLYSLFFLFPPLLIELLETENRKIKHLIRLQTGFGLAGLIWVLLTVEIHGKIIGALIGGTGYILFVFTRKKNQAKDICEGCPALNNRGICEGLSHKEKAMREYNDYLTNLYEKAIREKFVTREGISEF